MVRILGLKGTGFRGSRRGPRKDPVSAQIIQASLQIRVSMASGLACLCSLCRQCEKCRQRSGGSRAPKFLQEPVSVTIIRCWSSMN